MTTANMTRQQMRDALWAEASRIMSTPNATTVGLELVTQIVIGMEISRVADILGRMADNG